VYPTAGQETMEEGRMTTVAGEPGVVFRTDATGLAWLAETADGNRDKQFTLVLDKDDQPQLRETVQEGDRLVTGVEVRTATTLRDRVPVESVIVKPRGYEAQSVDPREGYDALFWTESAVEKFLYPYYRSQRLWDKRMDRLMADFNTQREMVAVLHRAPSNSSTIDALVGGTLHVGCVGRDEQRKTDTLRWHSLLEYPRNA
jgi:hypothetical protein